MKTLKRILISTTLLALPLSALADNDGHGHKHHHKHHHQKHHYKHYDQRSHNGHYGHRPQFREHEHHVYHHDRRDYGPHVRQERVYVPAVVHAPVVAYPQGVTIHGNVHLPF
jgi:hypothetical protein